MRVIMLDVDGVLVTPDGLGNGKGVYRLKDPRRHHARIDPEAVDLLGEIIVQTDARVVVSSTWRRHEPEMGGLRLAFNAAGFHRDLIIGCTPNLGHDRPAEITAWLADHPEVETYVAIDDGYIEGHPMVKTTWANRQDGGGLQREHVAQAVQILVAPKTLSR